MSDPSLSTISLFQFVHFTLGSDAGSPLVSISWQTSGLPVSGSCAVLEILGLLLDTSK